MMDICGKLAVLDQLLEQLSVGGHKTLISQMTKMLNILGEKEEIFSPGRLGELPVVAVNY